MLCASFLGQKQGSNRVGDFIIVKCAGSIEIYKIITQQQQLTFCQISLETQCA